MKTQNRNFPSNFLFKDAVLSILADKFHCKISIFMQIIKKLFTIQQNVRIVTEVLCIHIMNLNDIKSSN
jgi:hypothetical protein